jgi:hypothetical protein
MVDWEKAFCIDNGLTIGCGTEEALGIGNNQGKLVFKDRENSEVNLSTILSGFDTNRILFNNEGDLLIDQDFNALIGAM